MKEKNILFAIQSNTRVSINVIIVFFYRQKIKNTQNSCNAKTNQRKLSTRRSCYFITMGKLKYYKDKRKFSVKP